MIALVYRIGMSYWYFIDIKNISDDPNEDHLSNAYTRVNVELFDIPYYLFQIVLYSLLFSWIHLYFSLKVLLQEYENPGK
jgi:hypothetical protein